MRLEAQKPIKNRYLKRIGPFGGSHKELPLDLLRTELQKRVWRALFGLPHHHHHPPNEWCDALAQAAPRGVAGPKKEDIVPSIKSLL